MEDSQEIYSDMEQVEWMGSRGATQTGYASISGAKVATCTLGKSNVMGERRVVVNSVSWIAILLWICTHMYPYLISACQAHTQDTHMHA